MVTALLIIFQLSNYWSWYKKLKNNYKVFIDEFSSEEEPDLSPGKHGKWNNFIEETLKKKKDLSLVAGMNKFTRDILIKNNIIQLMILHLPTIFQILLK